MGPALIGQAVGLFALTSIDDDLDIELYEPIWLRRLDPRPSIRLPDRNEHKSFTDDASLGVRQVLRSSRTG